MDEVRSCKHHGDTAHYKRTDKKWAGWRCRKCNTEAVTKRRHKVITELMLRAGGCCKNCGYSKNRGALQFHHRDPATKSFTLGSNKNLGFQKLKDEADKCDLLCGNCHAEVTHPHLTDWKKS